MSSRRRIRELAMQVLFFWDTHGQRDAVLAAEVGGADVDDETRIAGLKLATAAWDGRETADAWIARLAPQWPPRRQPGVDRAILRLAVHEMTAAGTPPRVVIDEAVELAKSFSTEQSPAFINGVLDAVMKEVQQLTTGAAGGGASGGGASGSASGSASGNVNDTVGGGG